MSGVREYLTHQVELLAQAEPSASYQEPPRIDEWDDYAGELNVALAFSDGTALHIYLQVTLDEDYTVSAGTDRISLVTRRGEKDDRCARNWYYPRWDVYSFHYQRPDGEMILRYDNAPHHHQLSNFPHHLHIGTREIRASGLPTARQLAAAVRWHLDHPGERWQP